jgi:hypothetical protein
MTGMVAPMVLDGPINGNWFEAYVGQVLVPDHRSAPTPSLAAAMPQTERKPL